MNVAFAPTPTGTVASVSSHEQTSHVPPVNGIVRTKAKRASVTVRVSTKVVPGSAAHVGAHGAPPAGR